MKHFIIIGFAVNCFVATIQPCSSVRLTDNWRNAWMWFENEVTEMGSGAKTFLSRVVLGPLLSVTFKAAHMGYNFKDLLEDRLLGFILQQNHLIQEEFSFFQEKAIENIADLYKLAMNNYNCTCEFYHCGCCGHAEENWLLDLNATGCFRISYLVDDYGFGLGITLNGHTICNETVSELDAAVKTEGEELLISKNYLRKESGSCTCKNYNCGCCAHIEESVIDLNSTICANASYLVKDHGISLTVTVNHYTIFNETVSVRNPPPVCLGVPFIKPLAAACVHLYDIQAKGGHLHACIAVEARMKGIVVVKYEIGCFELLGLETDDTAQKQYVSVLMV